MKPWIRIGLLAVIGLGLATFLIHGLRWTSNTRGSPTTASASSLANSAWMKPPRDALPATSPSKTDYGAAPVVEDWPALFSSSTDYFAFVKNAAVPALHGDGTAALYVARAVEVCQLQVALYGHAQDPQSTFENWLSAQEHMPEPEVTKLQRRFNLCRGFFGGDAFASLPPRKGGYLSFSYWLNTSSDDGNPVAEVIHVANELPAVGNGGNREVAMKAQSTLISAVSTGDPEAVFRTGYLLLSGHAANSVDAYALAIAGCDLGYDCSANNSYIFGECAKLGHCPPGLNFQDRIRQEIGPAGYAKAYEMAQQVEAAISQRDTTAISKVVYLSK